MKYILPPTIQAGATFEACAALAAYPAPDWALNAYLRGPSVINLAAAADGAGHKFTQDAATTAGWAAGIYSYVVRASKGGEVFQVEAGTLEIAADLATQAEPGDVRTHAQRTLDAIEAVIEKRATKDQERYTINNRELWRTPIADLLKLRNTYRAEVRSERAKARGKSLWGAAVKVRL